MKINLLWTAAITELKFMKLLIKTEIAEVTEIVEITVIILIFKKWLFKAILNLTDAVLTAATVQN